MFGVSPCTPQNTLVVSTYDQRGQPSSRSAVPMIVSLLPPAYASALSKKLQPASPAAAMHSSARSVSSWVSNVTQLPNDSTLTLRPVLPSRRYSIFGLTLGVAMAADHTRRRPGRHRRAGPTLQGQPVERQRGLRPAARSAAICSAIRSSTGTAQLADRACVRRRVERRRQLRSAMATATSSTSSAGTTSSR